MFVASPDEAVLAVMGIGPIRIRREAISAP
jgi:hypothetical protein